MYGHSHFNMWSKNIGQFMGEEIWNMAAGSLENACPFIEYHVDCSNSLELFNMEQSFQDGFLQDIIASTLSKWPTQTKYTNHNSNIASYYVASTLRPMFLCYSGISCTSSYWQWSLIIKHNENILQDDRFQTKKFYNSKRIIFLEAHYMQCFVNSWSTTHFGQMP